MLGATVSTGRSGADMSQCSPTTPDDADPRDHRRHARAGEERRGSRWLRVSAAARIAVAVGEELGGIAVVAGEERRGSRWPRVSSAQRVSKPSVVLPTRTRVGRQCSGSGSR